ncbi:MAG: AraC family transcriptional regulator [Hyphomicrobiales bacterium]|nr:AraC family transcriptional regulator [Hyphomicrobiales bacterium]
MSKESGRPADITHTSPSPSDDVTGAEQRTATMEMTRVLKMKPVRVVSDASSGSIAHWRHDPVHDVVGPMTDHVVMTFPAGSQRFERRTGKSVDNGTARPGVISIISAGSSSRWDIPQPLNVVQLYLPQTTLERVASEANVVGPRDLLDRSANPDLITSRLLMSAADSLDGSAALDMLFRHQLTDLLATRLLSAHAGAPVKLLPVIGGLSPAALLRSIERLRSDSDSDVSLAALASDVGLSRFHFCRAFKESTGLSPHAWLRQHRLEQAMNMLRDTDTSVGSVAAALGYASQTAFAAAFRKLTGETPSDWRRRVR